MRAYVLIDSTRKAAGKIAAELQDKPGVIVADAVNGPHPVIACVEADNPASIAQTVLFDIRKIEGVKDLTVFLSIDNYDNRHIGDTVPDSLLPDLTESITGNTESRRKRSRKVNG